MQNCGMNCKIINYIDCHNIDVEFDNGYVVKNREYAAFLDGSINNPYCPSVYGVGIVGEKYYNRENTEKTKEYYAWINILKRCYSKSLKVKRPTYRDVVCCQEWWFFDNFYKWIHSQDNFAYWVNGDRWAVDKDIIIKGNKIYSPATCCLVPPNINSLFTKANNTRGDLPIGVVYMPKHNLYRAYLSIDNKRKSLGTFTTSDEAFKAYKMEKELYIKDVAEKEYSNGNITNECYKAMMNYEVEITD